MEWSSARIFEDRKESVIIVKYWCISLFSFWCNMASVNDVLVLIKDKIK